MSLIGLDICTLAQAIADGELNFRKLTRKNDDDVRDSHTVVISED